MWSLQLPGSTINGNVAITWKQFFGDVNRDVNRDVNCDVNRDVNRAINRDAGHKDRPISTWNL